MGRGFEHIASVFAEARKLGAAARRRYLDEACDGDDELRAEVESLLAAHDAAPRPDEADPFLPPRPDLAARAMRDAQQAAGERPEVPGFRILQRLAEGGMGTVYVAEQDRPLRQVALKVLRPEGATPDGRRRFEREAEALARLDHPGIAHVLVFGMTAGPAAPRPFIAMDLVEGEPLTKAAARLDLPRRVALLAEVAEAVAHAHAKGVIHRDLKPDNILVPSSGNPKVVDFGVARLVDDDAARQTRAGLVIGTLAYMSPEQARGDVESMDTRSDVYSLGVIAYEVLCGRHPLGEDPGTFTEVVRRIVGEQPPDPGALSPDLRGDLTLILRKALAKEPEQRYASASALAEDLRRHLRDEPILARPLTGAYQVRWFLRRHRRAVIGSALGLVLLIAGLIGALALARSERQQRLRADRSIEAMERALAQRNLQTAASSLREHETQAAVEALERVPPALRGWEWAYLMADTDDSIDHAPLDRGPLEDACIGGSAQPALCLDRHGTVWVQPRRSDGWTELDLPASCVQRAITTLGEQPVVVSREGAALVVHAGDGREVLRAKLGGGRPIQVASGSADGRLLAVAQDGAQAWCPLEVFELPSGASLLRGTAGLVGIDALLVDGDGRRVFSGGWRTRVRAQPLSPAAGRVVTFAGHAREVTALALAPGGTRLASGSADQTARIWDLETGQQILRIDDEHGAIRALAFTTDGRQLVTGTGRGALSVWDATEGRRLRMLHGHRGAIHDVRFAGELLESVGDDGIRRWRLAGDANVLAHHRQPVAERPTSYVYGVTFSPDGRRLATAAWDGTVGVVDLVTGELERTLSLSGQYLRDVRWSPDGRSLVAGHTKLARWDATTGELEAMQEVPGGIECLAHVSGGERLVTGDGKGMLELRDAASLRVVESWPCAGGAIADLSVDSAGRRVATISRGGQVVVRSLRDGRVLWEARAHRAGPFGAVAISPDARWLVSGGPDQRIRLWAAETGEPIAEFTGHTDPVYALAWLPDGSRFFSGARDGSLWIWNPRASSERLRLGAHGDYIYRLAVSPDGATVASASGDNTVRLWTTRTWHEREVVRRAALAEPDATPEGAR